MHFRNVTSRMPKFRVTFMDNSYVEMSGVMTALREVNFDGIVIPDHVPGRGYPAANNTYTLGYMKGAARPRECRGPASVRHPHTEHRRLARSSG